MKKFIVTMICCISSLSTFAQTSATDTTFILQESDMNSPYHAVFIENNPDSKYYDMISEFKFTRHDAGSYYQVMRHLSKNNSVRLKKHRLPDIPLQWCPLYTYKQKYFVYAPCDWGNNGKRQITDSTYTRFYMDGALPDRLDSIKTVTKDIYELSLTSYDNSPIKLRIHFINREQQIAVFEEIYSNNKYRYQLMIGKTKIKSFPIIVNYCPGQKQFEYQFEQPDYRKLISIKN